MPSEDYRARLLLAGELSVSSVLLLLLLPLVLLLLFFFFFVLFLRTV